MREKRVNDDAQAAAVAARQHGVVTIAQLNHAGIDKSAVARRMRAGRLHRIHRGVYALGHPGLSQEGSWLAAALACGSHAVLSHRSAAELWGLLPQAGGPIHVTVPAASGGRRSRDGLSIHRSSLPRADATTQNRIPVTTSARTITDLKPTVPGTTLRKAIREAEYRGLDLGGLPTDRTRSELERAFLALCRRHRLPEPEVNVPIGRLTVDFLWREQRLAVETDGYRAHRGAQAFEDDRERELELGLAGIRLRRFTTNQVPTRPAQVARAVDLALQTPGI